MMSGGWEGNRKSGVALYAPIRAIHSTETAIGIRDDDDDDNDVMASSVKKTVINTVLINGLSTSTYRLQLFSCVDDAEFCGRL